MSEKYNYRSSITGKYVGKEYANKHKDTTEKERRKTSKKKPTKKKRKK